VFAGRSAPDLIRKSSGWGAGLQTFDVWTIPFNHQPGGIDAMKVLTFSLVALFGAAAALIVGLAGTALAGLGAGGVGGIKNRSLVVTMWLLYLMAVK
jgi:hypothetical protein